MSYRWHRRRAGQSLPLLALIMIVLIAFVGLSVDVGNAYGQQRRMQNAANAGALGGLNAWLDAQTEPAGWTNAKVWANVKQALAGNQIAIDQSAYQYEASYITAGNATPVLLGRWNGSAETVNSGASAPPAGVDRIRVRVTHRLDTFFARAVGRDTLTVNASGDACWGNYGLGIMPIGIPAQLQPYDDGKGKGTGKDKGKGSGLRAPAAQKPSPSPSAAPTPTPVPEPFDRIFDGWDDRNNNGQPDDGDALGAEVSPSSAEWGDWDDAMIGKAVYMPIENKSVDPGLPGSHIGWLDWTGSGGGASELGTALTLPGTLKNGFTEAKPPINNRLEIGDWVDGHTGVKGSEADELQALLGKEILLPFYGAAEDNGTKAKYEVIGIGKFKIIGYELTGSDTGQEGVPPPEDDDNKYLIVQYLGPADEGTASGCAAVVP